MGIRQKIGVGFFVFWASFFISFTGAAKDRGEALTFSEPVVTASESERDQFDRIMETSPAGITGVDANGSIIFANRRAEEILGIRAAEISGRTYNDPGWKITHFDGTPYPEAQLPYNLVRKTGKPVFDVRHAIERADGNRLLLSINAMPLFTDTGDFDGIVASINDITENYKTEQKNQMIDGFSLCSFRMPTVISDMSMPNLTGIQLAQEIFRVRRDLPVIICTGFSEKLHQAVMEHTGIKGVLMKPVIRSKMAGMVREVLDSALTAKGSLQTE